MLISVCKSKIHRATVTDADLNYVGSLTIDEELMKAADLVEFEKIQVANISNGERFETYVIKGEAGSGVIGLNGAAARKGQKGDLIIIIAYGLISKDDAVDHSPSIVIVDENNRLVSR
ncbi:aspartate 1-decarboxylase [candidate division GN15 bacterium]|nr:aspartate 1-decarboxylase [candidate division GN15 bacterium]